MKIFSPYEIISFAREYSQYYRNLYKGIPGDASLESYPLIKSQDFWAATAQGETLTSTHHVGRVFNSGGTTGNPKYCPYTREEWQTMCELLGEKNDQYIMQDGDIAINTFYAGNLYASYDFVLQMHCCSSLDYLLLNSGGHIPISDIVRHIRQHKVTVILGLPSLILKIIEYIEEHKITDTYIAKICYAGETLQYTARSYINEVLGREVAYSSFGLAGNDYGVVGYFSSDCGFNEHRVDDKACVFELIDSDTGEIITEENRVGKVYITSRFKRLMPLIRYPIGDNAIYTEPPQKNRKFRLMGRADDAARVGIVNVYRADVEICINKLNFVNWGYQLIVTHEANALDTLTIKVATQEDVAQKLLDELYVMRPMLLETTQKNMINPTIVVTCGASDLEYNPRTGKLMHIIDKRFV